MPWEEDAAYIFMFFSMYSSLFNWECTFYEVFYVELTSTTVILNENASAPVSLVIVIKLEDLIL